MALIIIDYEPDHYIFASYGPDTCIYNKSEGSQN